MPTAANTQNRIASPRSHSARTALCLIAFVATVIMVYRTVGSKVDGLDDSSPDRVAISLSCANHDASGAIRPVNGLVQHYATSHAGETTTALENEYLVAERAAEKARNEYIETRGRFNDFVKRHFLEHHARAERLLAQQTSTSNTPDLWPVEPRMIENPEWTKLEGEHTRLEQRLDGLLADLTPLHPDVRDVESRIVGLKQRLASMPQQIPAKELGPSRGLPGTGDDGVADETRSSAGGSAKLSIETPEAHMAAVEAFESHKEMLDVAQEKYDRLSDIKRKAWEKRVRGPRIDLELAEATQTAESQLGALSPRLLLLALTAALAMASGVGLICWGFSADPPLMSRSEAEESLPVAIVGVLPSTPGQSADDDLPHTRPMDGPMRIFYGVVLIAACLGVVLMIAWSGACGPVMPI